jgi:hypothetical protein
VQVQQFNCPQCGAPLDIKTLGRSKAIVCPYCHTQIDLTRPPYQAIANVGPRPDPIGTPFQLGMQGTLNGESYQIIGRVRYRDDEDVWDEWLLLSAAGAYRWISDSEDVGLVLWYPFNPPTPINPAQIDRGATIQLGGSPARVRSKGTSYIAYLEGELTWRATIGDRMDYAEAAAPEAMYSIEWTENEIEFYQGRRLDRRQVEQAFGLAGDRGLAASGAGGAAAGGPPRRGGCLAGGGSVIIVLIVLIIICFVISAMGSGGYISGGGFADPSIRSGSSGRSVGGGGSGGGGK